MTTHTLRRWGAVLLSGGLCLTVAYAIYPSSAHSSMIRPAATLGLVGILLALTGLVGFQRGQSGHARTNGWIGTLLTVVALAMLEIPHLVFGAFAPSKLYDLDSYHAGVWGTLAFGGLVLLPVALIVLAVATWRARVYPRWAAWLLVANIAVAALEQGVPAMGDALHQPAPNYALMGLLGMAMFWLSRQRADDTAEIHRRDPATSASR